MGVRCWQSEHRSIIMLALLALTLYPLGLPCIYGALLYTARAAITSNRPTALSKALTFLHDSYRPDSTCFWWEVAEMIRRVILVGVFVTVRPGSILQLTLATLFCITYLIFLLQSRPYRSVADALLAVATSVSMLLMFICSICLKFEAGLAELSLSTPIPTETREALTLSRAALGGVSFLAIFFSLVFSALIIAQQAAVERFMAHRELSLARRRRLRHASDGREAVAPAVVPGEYHLFLSHVWGTGQDQMRVVKQRLLELLPDLNVFLDVDDLEDISDLEGYVARSHRVLVFCSTGYFESQLHARAIHMRRTAHRAHRVA